MQKCLFGGAWLDLPVSPTTIPSYDTPRFIMFHVQLKINFWTILGPYIFVTCLYFSVSSGLERGRHYKVCADMDGVGSLQMVDTLREVGQGWYMLAIVGISQTWGS